MAPDLRKQATGSARKCLTCGGAIPPQQGSARPRKYCATCRPPRNRPNPRLITLPTPAESLVDAESAVVSAYRQVLVESERLGTPEGAHVMHLANLFALGQHTAAGAASLSKELRAAMEAALAGAPEKADTMDELEARRRQKADLA